MFPAFTGFIMFLTLLSCQKEDLGNRFSNITELKDISIASDEMNYSDYFGPVTFTITTKDAVNVTYAIPGDDFEYFESFVIKAENGTGGSTRVNKVEISIDGKVLVSHSDFKGKQLLVTKSLSNLTPQSILLVKLSGSKGRFVKITIGGMLKPGIISDIDNNHYKTVLICGRWWMAENLRTTRFNDGTTIPNVTEKSEWEKLGGNRTAAYCWYNNDISYKKPYGALYSGTAVDVLHSNKLCPVGWHVADAEWFWMIECLDPDMIYGNTRISEFAGNLLIEQGNSHWMCPENNSTNQTGLTLLPGGLRYITEPEFRGIRKGGVYWTGGSGKIFFGCDGGVDFSEGWDDYGLSVRCVKNE